MGDDVLLDHQGWHLRGENDAWRRSFLHEEDFDNGTVDICTQEFKLEDRQLESAGKPSSHSLSERRANEPRIYSSTQPTIEINSLFDKIEFVSFSMSKTRFVVLNASWSTRLLSSVGRCFECVVVEWTRANGHSPRGGVDLTHQHSTTDGHSPLPLVHFTSLRSSAH